VPAATVTVADASPASALGVPGDPGAASGAALPAPEPPPDPADTDGDGTGVGVGTGAGGDTGPGSAVGAGGGILGPAPDAFTATKRNVYFVPGVNPVNSTVPPTPPRIVTD
jgi:hypothetical protein